MFLKEVSHAAKNRGKQEYVWMLLQFKITVFYFNIHDVIYSCGGKTEFSAAISPVSQYHFNILIWCSRNIS